MEDPAYEFEGPKYHNFSTAGDEEETADQWFRGRASSCSEPAGDEYGEPCGEDVFFEEDEAAAEGDEDDEGSENDAAENEPDQKRRRIGRDVAKPTVPKSPNFTSAKRYALSRNPSFQEP